MRISRGQTANHSLIGSNHGLAVSWGLAVPGFRWLRRIQKWPWTALQSEMALAIGLGPLLMDLLDTLW